MSPNSLLFPMLGAQSGKDQSQYIYQISRAAAFAAEAHKLQTRKGTLTPYINHPLRVAHHAAVAGLDFAAIVAAFLHDVVEDTDVTIEDIAAEFPPGVVGHVSRLTKWWPDSADEQVKKTEKVVYYAAIRSNPQTLALKNLDRADNLAEFLQDLDGPAPNLKWSRNYLRKTQHEFTDNGLFLCENQFASELLQSVIGALATRLVDEGYGDPSFHRFAKVSQ